MPMEKGDLLFKAVAAIYDSWRTVTKFEVVHYDNKDNILAVVKKNSTRVQDTEYTVRIDNVRVVVSSLDDALDFIVDYHD